MRGTHVFHLLLATGLFVTAICVADDSAQKKSAANDAKPAATKATSINREAQQKALQKFAGLIGAWRGVGQPKRGSRNGAWSEKAEWIWDFSKAGVSIRSQIDKGKLAKSIRIRTGKTPKTFQVELEPIEGQTTKFSMKLDGKNVIGESPAKDGYVQRLTITQLNEKRSLLLLEKRKENQTFYSRVAGIGYTRAGTSLAVAGNKGPICVVTGGKGTIAVYHKGKKYYVCCTGCKSAFDDDPEGILADYHEQLKEAEQKKKAASTTKNAS